MVAHSYGEASVKRICPYCLLWLRDAKLRPVRRGQARHGTLMSSWVSFSFLLASKVQSVFVLPSLSQCLVHFAGVRLGDLR